jgi:hypothetical protein
MRIVFVENRYKTAFWEALANPLVADGHDVSWVVQNPLFSPMSQNTYFIPFPKRADFEECSADEFLVKIEASDRVKNYFAGDSRHYNYYWREICRLLDLIKPELVIGEATLFHELMINAWCVRNRIPYVNPSSPGYPNGRFSFYRGDTKETYFDSNNTVTTEECEELINAINERTVIPDYMKKAEVHSGVKSWPKAGSLKDKWLKIRGYYIGDRFNTPSPILKYLVERKQQTLRQTWDNLALVKDGSNHKKFRMLYAMQMQPEANIDVWGYPHNDQTLLIDLVSSILPDDWSLVVKLNPKCKYELTDELVSLVEARSNVIPVPLSSSMAGVIPSISMITTVTGTIAVEGYLRGLPVISVGPSILEGSQGAFSEVDVDGVKSALDSYIQGHWQAPSEEDKVALVRKLFSKSFGGSITDPSSSPACISATNLSLVGMGINMLICQVSQENGRS